MISSCTTCGGIGEVMEIPDGCTPMMLTCHSCSGVGKIYREDDKDQVIKKLVQTVIALDGEIDGDARVLHQIEETAPVVAWCEKYIRSLT